MEELYEYVSPDILPEEYGGRGGPFSNKDIQEAIMKHGKHFREVREIADKYKKNHPQ